MESMPIPWNASRFRADDPLGLYESYFQRGNHPTRPLAFWIRYTVFSPRAYPEQARGELWAIYFDGETQRIIAAKQAVPVADCDFSHSGLNVRIGRATLDDQELTGSARSSAHAIEWKLAYVGDEPPLLLLPEKFYSRNLPRAKALVGTPNAIYTGILRVDGEEIVTDGWRGSQNHNWGRRHTDRYAWGQVAGFDNAPESFLECCTAQLKLGPVWSPRMTLLVLRDEGQEIAVNGLLQSVRATGNVDAFAWQIDTCNAHARIHGRIHAPVDAFVGLTYDNPPGGSKTCLNCKLASAEFVIERPGKPSRTLLAARRAAFEILTDRNDHGVPVIA
jgi:hypothetical protein